MKTGRNRGVVWGARWHDEQTEKPPGKRSRPSTWWQGSTTTCAVSGTVCMALCPYWGDRREERSAEFVGICCMCGRGLLWGSLVLQYRFYTSCVRLRAFCSEVLPAGGSKTGRHWKGASPPWHSVCVCVWVQSRWSRHTQQTSRSPPHVSQHNLWFLICCVTLSAALALDPMHSAFCLDASIYSS